MKHTKVLIALVAILAICVVGIVACDNPQPTTLSAPTITLDEDTKVVSWQAVANATGYEIKIGNDAAVAVDGTSYTVTKTVPGSYDITVVAKGDGVSFLDSVASNKVTLTVTNATITPTKLDAPTISLDNDTGIVSWSAVANAASYDIYVDNAKVKNQTALTYQLEKVVGSKTVAVVAVGNGVNYTNSDISNSVTYTVTATKLDAPQSALTATLSVGRQWTMQQAMP